MTAPSAPGEVTGLASVLAYASGMTAAYAAAAAEAERFAAGLSTYGVDGAAVAAAGRAQELTVQAGTAWAEASTALERQGTVRDGYAAVPDAGSRNFLTDAPPASSPAGPATAGALRTE